MIARRASRWSHSERFRPRQQVRPACRVVPRAAQTTLGTRPRAAARAAPGRGTAPGVVPAVPPELWPTVGWHLRMHLSMFRREETSTRNLLEDLAFVTARTVREPGDTRQFLGEQGLRLRWRPSVPEEPFFYRIQLRLWQVQREFKGVGAGVMRGNLAVEKRGPGIRMPVLMQFDVRFTVVGIGVGVGLAVYSENDGLAMRSCTTSAAGGPRPRSDAGPADDVVQPGGGALDRGERGRRRVEGVDERHLPGAGPHQRVNGPMRSGPSCAGVVPQGRDETLAAVRTVSASSATPASRPRQGGQEARAALRGTAGRGWTAARAAGRCPQQCLAAGQQHHARGVRPVRPPAGQSPRGRRPVGPLR